jgi:hypothetical protein
MPPQRQAHATTPSCGRYCFAHVYHLYLRFSLGLGFVWDDRRRNAKIVSAAFLFNSALGPAGFPVSPVNFDSLNPRLQPEGQGAVMSFKNLKYVYLGTSIDLNLWAIGQIVSRLLQGK